MECEQTQVQPNSFTQYSEMHPKSSLFSAGRAGIRIKKLHFLRGGWTFPQLCNKITPDRNSSSLLIHLAKARFISAHSRAFPSILPGLCNLLSACTSTLPVQVASTFTPQHSRHLSCSPAGLPPPAAALPCGGGSRPRPCSCPAPRPVSRSPPAEPRAAGTCEPLPA